MPKNLVLQREFYDQRWENQNYVNSYKLQRCISILSGINKTGIKNPKILDLGCGTGWLTNILGTFGPTVGVDLSNNAIQKAKERYPQIEFFSKDIYKIDDYGKNHFDIVVSQEVIEHFENQDQYLQIAFSQLKPKGFLILTTPNRYIFDTFPENKRKNWSNQPIENLLSIKELKHLVKKFSKIDYLTTIIPGFDPKGILRYVNAYLVKKVLRSINLQHQHEQILLKLGFGLHIFLIAQKFNNNREY